MRIDIDAWNPSYGTALAVETSDARPQSDSSAKTTVDVELPASEWRPLTPRGDHRSPGVVLLVDGVRRIDSQLWITEDNGNTYAGLVASFAAGVVRCDLMNGAADIAVTQIRRGLYTPSLTAKQLTAGTVVYPVRLVSHDDPSDLSLGVQRDLASLEKEVSLTARRQTEDTLLIVDGPLHGRTHLPQILGYIKSHRVEYLPTELTTVITTLKPGQRCPIFLLGTSWNRYTWYLRLPGPSGSPWAGVVRVECSADCAVAEAVHLADQSAVLLPRLASSTYKDPRAPQNLIPIAGLERRLRGMLGDSRLLHRGLIISAHRTAQLPEPLVCSAGSS